MKKKCVHVIRDHHNQIMTNDERLQLASWLLQCADGHMPKDRNEIAAKMRTMLRQRHAFNKRRKYGSGCIPLTPREVEFANSSDGMYQSLYANLFAWFK